MWLLATLIPNKTLWKMVMGNFSSGNVHDNTKSISLWKTNQSIWNPNSENFRFNSASGFIRTILADRICSLYNTKLSFFLFFYRGVWEAMHWMEVNRLPNQSFYLFCFVCELQTFDFWTAFEMIRSCVYSAYVYLSSLLPWLALSHVLKS